MPFGRDEYGLLGVGAVHEGMDFPFTVRQQAPLVRQDKSQLSDGFDRENVPEVHDEAAQGVAHGDA